VIALFLVLGFVTALWPPLGAAGWMVLAGVLLSRGYFN
jgi:hypothetical protein